MPTSTWSSTAGVRSSCRRTSSSPTSTGSRRTGVHLVAATGLHHERFYGRSHWSLTTTEDELAERFVADIEDGIDAEDGRGPVARRTAHRAGVVKVAGSD